MKEATTGAPLHAPQQRSKRMVRSLISVAAVYGFAAHVALAGTPYSGTPIAVPGTVQAENFDKGGEGVGYHDLTAGNKGGVYRTGEDVDITTSTDAQTGGYVVNSFQSSEWLAYTVSVGSSGSFDLAIRASNHYSSQPYFHIEVDGVNVTGTVPVPKTKNWNTFQWVTGNTGVALVAGQHVVKVVSDTQYFNMDAVRLSASARASGASTPYTGSPIALPMAFEAENFDKGGEGVAYHDLTLGNSGGQYRTSEDVDIISSTDSAGGGYVIDSFQTGEWLVYTISVQTSGPYDLSIRAANNGTSPGAFHFEIDGANVTGAVSVPVTGSWSSFQWMGVPNIQLQAGTHVLKLVAEMQYFDVNQISVLTGSTTTGTSAATTAIKWNPGHYVAVYPSSGAADMANQLAKSALFRGVEKTYDWNTLEPSRGTYNFTAISSDLDYLSSINKKLIILVRPNAFGMNENHVPSYITGPEFGGGVFYANLSGTTWAWEPVMWNTAVRDRFISLLQALAARFDSHPALEAIQVIDESAVQHFDPTVPQNAGVDAYSLTAFTNNLTSIATAARAAFTQTQTELGFNYPAGASPDPLPIWANAAQTTGFGLGAPDVIASATWLTNYSYTYFPNLSGFVPLHATVDWMDYEKDTVSNIYTYARDSLKATHIRWQERNTPTTYFDQVAAMLNSPGFPTDVAGGLSTSCPSAFSACK